ncbi:MAG: electron transport complex subunit E [Bacteroidales bacterium]|nr:electron transport complex subunit E [Bacteroidales bacterium]MCL2738153.1 electron transport complex subunit E [Bacteroidales bacterium]
MNKLQIITKGIIKENPVFVLLLGMCPVLGTSSSAINGLGMGVATMMVLIMSNAVVSIVAGAIPNQVRIPAYIVVIAGFTTVVQLMMQAYTPGLYATLGIFIPLIAVNCVLLARAEAYASKNSVLNSVFDGLGIGLGFTLALTALGAVRELLGSMSVFGYKFASGDGMLVFILAPGAFIALGYLIVIFNKLTKIKA